jgi:hypothetical protein
MALIMICVILALGHILIGYNIKIIYLFIFNILYIIIKLIKYIIILILKIKNLILEYKFPLKYQNIIKILILLKINVWN